MAASSETQLNEQVFIDHFGTRVPGQRKPIQGLKYFFFIHFKSSVQWLSATRFRGSFFWPSAPGDEPYATSVWETPVHPEAHIVVAEDVWEFFDSKCLR